MFMIPIAPTKRERPVMNKPGNGNRILDRIERAFQGLLLVDLKSSFFSGGKPRTRRIKPVSSSFASASFVLSFTFTKISASLLAREILLKGGQGHYYNRIQTEKAKKRALPGNNADHFEKLSVDETDLSMGLVRREKRVGHVVTDHADIRAAS